LQFEDVLGPLFFPRRIGDEDLVEPGDEGVADAEKILRGPAGRKDIDAAGGIDVRPLLHVAARLQEAEQFLLAFWNSGVSPAARLP